MAMGLPGLTDMLKNGLGSYDAKDDMSKTPDELGKGSTDSGEKSVKGFLNQLLGGSTPPGTVTDDSGSISPDQSNPFLSAIQTSRANGNTGPGVLKQLLGSLTNPSPNVGSAISTGPLTTQQATSPTPMANVKQANLAPTTPQAPPPSPYAQPTALDPVAIEQLRTSLLTQAGQMDPNNPNGLSGRMNSPNSNVDQAQGMRDSQNVENSFFNQGVSNTSGGVQQPQQPQESNTALKSDQG